MPAPRRPSPAAVAALGRLREQASVRLLTSAGGYTWAELASTTLFRMSVPQRLLRELEAASLYIPPDTRNPALVRLPVTESSP